MHEDCNGGFFGTDNAALASSDLNFFIFHGPLHGFNENKKAQVFYFKWFSQQRTLCNILM